MTELGGVAFGKVELRGTVYRPTHVQRDGQGEAEFIEWVKHRYPYPLVIIIRCNDGGKLTAEVETTIPPDMDVAGMQYLKTAS